MRSVCGLSRVCACTADAFCPPLAGALVVAYNADVGRETWVVWSNANELWLATS